MQDSCYGCRHPFYLRDKYKIKSNKTKFPVDISSLCEESLFCVMIGFIDGDGSVSLQTGRNDCKLSIKVHESWKDWLSYVYGREARINSKGYAFLSITDNTILRKWKMRLMLLNLPVMSRKWSIIDENTISRELTSKENLEKYKKDYTSGISVKDISIKYNKKYSTVYNSLLRNHIFKERRLSDE